MKKLLYSLSLLLCSPCWATWTLTQGPSTAINNACATGSTTCAVTVSSTGSSHLLVAGIASTANGTTISSVTPAACSVTWTHASSANLAGSAGSVDLYYCTKSASGQTSITITVNAAPGAAWTAAIWEASSSLGTIAIDSGATPSGNKNDSSNCTSCAGVSLTLSGNNDFIAAIATPGDTGTGLTGTGWTNDKVDASTNLYGHGITSGSQTAPATWTQTTANPLLCDAAAFQETSGTVAPAGFNKKRKIEKMDGI